MGVGRRSRRSKSADTRWSSVKERSASRSSVVTSAPGQPLSVAPLRRQSPSQRTHLTHRFSEIESGSTWPWTKETYHELLGALACGADVQKYASGVSGKKFPSIAGSCRVRSTMVSSSATLGSLQPVPSVVGQNVAASLQVRYWAISTVRHHVKPVVAS